ncbi:MAG: cytochrome c peroxidase [Planctomycetota bacterium]
MFRPALLIVAAGLAVLAIVNRDEATRTVTALLTPVDQAHCESADPYSKPAWERATPPAAAVTLGDASLLQGVPGTGPLTAQQARRWLGEAANHTPLSTHLPEGLLQATADQRGLAENRLTRAKIELGRQLFFDPRLSIDSTLSCASCHDPDHGYADSRAVSVGVGGRVGTRNAPTLANRVFSASQFWDGRAGSLEEQALGPIANHVEMGLSLVELVERLQAIEGYRLQFGAVFPDEPITAESIVNAIAAFERMLVAGPSSWDAHASLAAFERANDEDLAIAQETPAEQRDTYDAELVTEHHELVQAAEASPLSDAARRGAELFFGDRTGCTQCHAGLNYTDEQYHNLGMGLEGITDDSDPTVDWGRYAVTGDEADRGAFKTPTLRNVAETAPYMHDGTLGTLASVIDHYVAGGHENPWLSQRLEPLDLNTNEVADLVAFLEALTGPLPDVATGRLPE